MVLALMMTTQCNFHCSHCMVGSSQEFSWVSDEILEHFYHMLALGQPDEVYLLGGEVLLHLDEVEKIVARIKKTCQQIVIFSNGSFILDEEKVNRIDALNVTIRISDDRFHRKSWTPELEERILSSNYMLVSRDPDQDMIPVGRAYEEFKHLKYNMGCSLITGNYGEGYPNAYRYMVMLNGDVNLYCATIEAALANVFEDEDITYDLLVEREKRLHDYLFATVIKSEEDTYMAKLCNQCSRYKVTKDAIYYDGLLVSSSSAKTER